MSIFGSKKKYYVQSLVQPVYEDFDMTEVPTLGETVLGNVLRGEENLTITSSIISHYRNSTVANLRKLRNVAEKSYTHGLPAVYRTGKEFVRDYLVSSGISSVVGEMLPYDTIIERYDILKQSLRFVGAEIFYDIEFRERNQSTTLKGSLPLSELRPVTHNLFFTPKEYTEYLARKYPDRFPDKEWYTVISPTSSRALSKGTLDRLPTEDVSGTLFEVYPAIRLAKDSEYLEEASDEYKEAKKLLKICGLDISTVVESLKEGDTDNQLQAAFMVFGCTLTVQDTELSQPQKVYLHNFFSYLEAIAEDRPLYVLDHTKEVLSPKGEVRSQTDVFRISRYIKSVELLIKENEYNSSYSVGHITKEHIAGSIGSVGTVEIEVTKDTVGIKEDNEYYAKSDYRDSQRDADYTATSISPKTPFDITIRKQENGYYSEIKVYSLSQNTVVKISGRLKEDDREESHQVFIPYIRGILDGFNARDQQELFYRGMHITVYAGQVVKLKWYQTGFFQALMIFGAMVLTILYPPSGGWTWAAVLAAVGTALAIKFVVRMIIKAFPDSEFVQAIAIAAAVYFSFTLGGGATATTPTAVTALQISTMTLNFYAETELQQLGYQMEDWENELKNIQQETEVLEEMMAELVPDLSANSIEVFDSLIQPLKGETPEEFYARTLNDDPVEVVMNLYNHLNLSNGLPTV